MSTRLSRLLAAALMLALVFSLAGCSKSDNSSATSSSQAATTEQPVTTDQSAGTAGQDASADAGPGKVADVTELKIEDLKVGTGAEAVAGKTVTVNYTGWLTDGTKFDSSLDSGQPFSFVLGTGYVIPGWDQGVAGMKVGGKRRLTVPPALGYGANGAGGVIPPNATLVFDVELLNVQ